MAKNEARGRGGLGSTTGFWGSYRWVIKLFASATSVFAGLIAFGFFSEAALYEMAGLPRLSADPEYLAEAGARGLVSSLAAIGGEGALVLVVLLILIYAFWAVRDRPNVSSLLRSPEVLIGAQVVVLFAILSLVMTLVAVASLGTAQGRDRVERDIKVEIGRLRDHVDWTPSLERERSEELRMAPRKTAQWILGLGKAVRGLLPFEGSGTDSEMAQPSLGFPLRPTEKLRQQARDFYGWLFVLLIILACLVSVLWRWRAWAETQIPLRLVNLRLKKLSFGRSEPSSEVLEELPGPEPRVGSADARRQKYSWVALYRSSSLTLEPVLGILSLIAVSLIPSAHGVLAKESIGLQPVLVRLSAGIGGVCESKVPGKREEFQPDEADRKGAGTPGSSEQVEGFDKRSVETPRDRNTCTCESKELSVLDTEIPRFRRAWQEVTLSRVSDSDQYEEARRKFEEATDSLLRKALQLRCPEAFQRLVNLLPEPGELAIQPRIAEYFLYRFIDAVNQSGFALYGHVLAAPRGKERDRITLFSRLGLARWVFREVSRKQMAEIILLPNEKSGRVNSTLVAVRSSPVPEQLDQLALYPGAHTLHESLILLKSGLLPHSAQARLITIIGAMGRVVGTEESPGREEAINVLAGIAKKGLEAAAAGVSSPQVDLAGGAVTSLATVGGPYAARELVEVLELPRDSRERVVIDIEQLEAIPTLVTSAGYLASDVRESLRTLREGRHPDCAPVETESGSAIPDHCPSEEARTLLRLVDFLAAAAREETLDMSIRTAACGGLGLSLEPRAQNRAFGIGVGFLRDGEDFSAAQCLLHTPARLKDPQLEWLRAFARGKRSPGQEPGEQARSQTPSGGSPADGSVESTSALKSVPVWLRSMVLAELQEAGLWAEGDLIFDLLADFEKPSDEEQSKFLELVARVVEDVDGRESEKRLRSCAADTTMAPSIRRRCILAAGLINRVEDGDFGLTKAVLLPELTGDPADSGTELTKIQRFPEEACASAMVFAGRGGREAHRLLRDHQEICEPVVGKLAGDLGKFGGELPMVLVQAIATGKSFGEFADPDLQALLAGLRRASAEAAATDPSDLLESPRRFEEAQDSEGMESVDFGEAQRAARAAIANGDFGAFIAASTLLAQEGAGRDLSWLEEVARAEDDLFGDVALGTLVSVDTERWALLAAELYVSQEAGSRVLTAAKFLEDGTAEDNARRLVACLDSPRLRERCAVGLALLESSWFGSPAVLSRLEALAGTSAGACRALVELSLRNQGDLDEYAQRCPAALSEIGNIVDEQQRWIRHLLALIEVLREEGLAGDSASAVALEEAQLGQFLELLEALSTES